MRYEESDNANEYRQEIGLDAQKKSNSLNIRKFMKWFFTIDLKDWTNYIAIAVAGLLFWWGIKTIIVSLQ